MEICFLVLLASFLYNYLNNYGFILQEALLVNLQFRIMNFNAFSSGSVSKRSGSAGFNVMDPKGQLKGLIGFFSIAPLLVITFPTNNFAIAKLSL